jgi:pimeloyl-ACP methyl ester carboxylesterase
MKASIFSTAVAALAITVAVSGCGSSGEGEVEAGAGSPSTVDSTTTSTIHATATERPSRPVDRLVTIDHGRMHLRCVGRGETTVLLIAGWGDGGENWGAVEPALSEQARVCSYARFGTGASDPPPATQTFATWATDLHALLDVAGEPGPYVVLGHSFGGPEAVTFASRYADEVNGVLLLDASPTTWPETACSVASYEALCASMRDPALDPEHLDVFPAFAEVATISSLGDLPVRVVTAAHRADPSLASSELARLDEAWAKGMQRWAGLSSSSRIVTVEDTGHHIELQRPEVVIDEVRDLLRAGPHA